MFHTATPKKRSSELNSGEENRLSVRSANMNTTIVSCSALDESSFSGTERTEAQGTHRTWGDGK